jgi:glycosyltransferase involved in cell wall biosynthesis
MTKSLYICYFGLREPLVQTQVLPYLRELAKSGVAIFLLTFEPERWDDAQMREQLRVDGIEWFASKYHKRPTVPATLFDVLAGALRAIRIVRRNGIGIIHARSHVPALMGAIAKRFTRAKLLFDVRGLMADEYVESGNWRAGGWLFRLAKRVERFLLRNSDAFVVLTEKVRAELFASEAKPLEVIPCCIDPARFASAERERMHERIVIVYVGALGNTYLPREMAEFFAAAKAADARVFPLILTQSRPEIIREHLAACGFQPSDYQIGFATAAELPSYLASSDIAISFVRPGRSRIAASPTKFAEYLAAGLPVISTRGIGDLDAQIENARVGVLLDGLDRDSYRRAFEAVQALRRDDELPRRCRALAVSEYDLHTVGGVRYARLYARLTER